jgi:hypothetical protein
VGPRSSLEAVEKKKIPSPRWESKPRTPIIQSVLVENRGAAITSNLLEFVVDVISRRNVYGVENSFRIIVIL